MPALPSPGRCYRLGGVLKEYVETERPADERVVVVGTRRPLALALPARAGGRVAVDFDQDFIDRMIAGRSEELAALSAAEIEAASGNGGLEPDSLAFHGRRGAAGRGEQLYYEPIPEWISGMGGLALTPASAG